MFFAPIGHICKIKELFIVHTVYEASSQKLNNFVKIKYHKTFYLTPLNLN